MHATQEPGHRVANGVGRLAPACPRWWSADVERPIDPFAIDLTDPEDAGILARVYGSHSEGLKLLHIPPELAPEFGFAALGPADADALAHAWLLTIIASRAEHGSRPPH